MKNKNIFLISILIIIVIAFFIVFNEIIPIINEKDSKNRIFNDMQEKSDEVIRGIVGIIPKNDNNGLSSYNGIGS